MGCKSCVRGVRVFINTNTKLKAIMHFASNRKNAFIINNMKGDLKSIFTLICEMPQACRACSRCLQRCVIVARDRYTGISDLFQSRNSNIDIQGRP